MNQYRSNGRTKRALHRIEYWQMRLNAGWSVDDIVEEAIQHRNDKAVARCQYRHRINDLIATRVLKCVTT